MKIILFYLVVFLVLGALAPNASAAGFAIDWKDIFPVCAEVGSSDMYANMRCVAEFTVPNFHLGLIFDLVMKSVSSFFMVNGITSSIEKFVTDPVGSVHGAGEWVYNLAKDSFFPDYSKLGDPDAKVGILGVSSKLFQAIFDWLVGVFVPIFVILGLIAFEIVKAYLLLGALYLMLVYTLQSINLTGLTPPFSIGLVVAFLALMVFASLYLMTLDMGGFADYPLFRWG
jgi:hypothetical protein